MASQQNSAARGFFFGVLLMTVMILGAIGGALADRLFVIKPFDYIAKRVLPGSDSGILAPGQFTQRVVNEESTVIDAAEKSSPSVVTVSITQERSRMEPFFMDPFGLFGPQFRQGPSEQITQDIGTGFVVDSTQGLIVTNKHVVDSEGTYKIITKDNKEYDVKNIYRDPANDLAILKVDAQIPAMELGDSDQIKVGQFVIAIGTALGEFRHTVTTGVVSGLGRGIEAGSGFGGYVERLDNVIQTDAAINPGNSGGPLLNSAGQVVGVNVAVAQGGQNIGFAIPINVVKQSLDNFNKTGQFNRPFLGVQYRMLPRQTALMNDLPEGAYIIEVMDGSSAAEAGLRPGDVITSMAGKSVKEENGGLATIINTLKVGDRVDVEYYRDGQAQKVTVTMKTSEE